MSTIDYNSPSKVSISKKERPFPGIENYEILHRISSGSYA
jgi:hypothetical protein